MSVFSWFLANKEVLGLGLAALLAVVWVVVRLTKTPKDDAALSTVQDILVRLGLLKAPEAVTPPPVESADAPLLRERTEPEPDAKPGRQPLDR